MRKTIITIGSVIAGTALVVAGPAVAHSKGQHHGTIIIHKVVVGKPGLFQFLVNGQVIGTGGNGATFTYTKDEHGQDVENTVSEQPLASNTQTYTAKVVCVSDLEGVVAVGGSSTSPGDVSLKNGETVTCTFTNTDDTPPPPLDVCKNLPGVQHRVPAGYLGVKGKCYKVSPPPQRHHHKHHQPTAKRQVSQPSAIVKAPPLVTATVQQIADSGAGGG